MAKPSADPELLAATDLARAALLEVTNGEHIGDLVGHEADESGAVTLFFESKLSGYPGWRWAASLAKASADAQPTVLEVEMLPGDGALLSPEWVPWSVRLAQYRESQAALEAERRAALAAAAELGEEDVVLVDDDEAEALAGVSDELDDEDDLDDEYDDDDLDDDIDAVLESALEHEFDALDGNEDDDEDQDEEEEEDEDQDDDDLDDDLDDDILVNDFSDFDDEIDGVDIDSIDPETASPGDDLDSDSDSDDDEASSSR